MARTIRHYSAFSKQEQEIYENDLNDEQRNYIEFRRQGHNRADSYRMAYNYAGKYGGQNAKNLERRTPVITQLVDTLLSDIKLSELTAAKNGELNQIIDTKAKQRKVEEVISAIEGADSEEAQRIQFYRDIINGKIKSVKTTIKKDKNGQVVSTTTEVKDDVTARITAREKLDKVLGLNKIVDLGQMEVGGITIKIVDATKKPEKIDTSENNIDIDKDNIVEVDESEVEDNGGEA